MGGAWLRPYRVGSLVESMAQEADALASASGKPPEHQPDESFGTTMRNLYGDLSEHSHPNWAATTLSQSLSAQLEPTWELQPPVRESDLTLIAVAYLCLYFGRSAWDSVVEASRQHPVTLPKNEEFGPGDVHAVPEATEDSEPSDSTIT